MIRHTLAVLSLVACVACSRDEPAPAPIADPVPVPVEPSPAPVATPPVAVAPGPVAPAPEDPSIRFDKGNFAGTFVGGGTTLNLRGDGTYELDGPAGPSQGAWSHEPSSNAVRLDPGSKGEQDRVFRMDSPDTLAAIGADGQPMGDALRRRVR